MDDLLKPKKVLAPGAVIRADRAEYVILGWICEETKETREIVICGFHNKTSGVRQLIAPSYKIVENLGMAELLTHKNEQVREWFARLSKGEVSDNQLGNYFIITNEKNASKEDEDEESDEELDVAHYKSKWIESTKSEYEKQAFAYKQMSKERIKRMLEKAKREAEQICETDNNLEF